MTNAAAKTMSLGRLLKPLIDKSVSKQYSDILDNITLSGISQDSRELDKGNLFIATKGFSCDARNYFNQALKNSIAAIIAEKEGLEQKVILIEGYQIKELENDVFLLEKNGVSVPLIAVQDLSHNIATLAARFYRNPTKKMTTIGITGTNGKTSCCYLTAQVLEFLQHKTLMLSTIGNGNIEALNKTINTTPSALEIQQKAAHYLQQKSQYLAMEVSSHGLELGRVDGINYKVAVFTNLSQDHLDFHGDMESYFEAKRKLFLKSSLKSAVINADDPYGKRLLQDTEITCEKIAYTCQEKDQTLNIDKWIFARNIEFNLTGLSADLETQWGNARIRSNLIGEFNVSNLLAVAGTLGALFGDINRWIVALNEAKAVPGRMHKFSGENKATVIVDYAHTPDALDKALNTLRKHTKGKLWCIFGCGGDRDNSKRSLMGATAERHADVVVITDDNPRSEQPSNIVQMIKSGMTHDAKYIASRKQAIEYALNNAKANDMILVAGKGHENYQIIGEDIIDYSDLQTVAKLMEVSL